MLSLFPVQGLTSRSSTDLAHSANRMLTHLDGPLDQEEDNRDQVMLPAEDLTNHPAEQGCISQAE